MKNRKCSIVLTSLAVVVACLGGTVLTGCASQHDVAPVAEGKVSVCSKCYATIRTVRDAPGGGRSSPSYNHTVVTHTCDECKSEMTVYEENGVLKARCPKCAPEGVDCDRCVPKARSN